ncbi:dethiobiotin synthase [Rubinisphaera italica]|uniref:ATP-dependent dethiobiotin synthetase BioD n=1 Tax=Rubinisphaera italica TaxID=2527969 RepID=A0A5C5XCH0_9PLAN|nr:dethiobiotin synthase [Rubinisphaera italica]TWT60141.1 ATP-dependent dethiobiotin synthetase BioD [Rubinisphaera italica]
MRGLFVTGTDTDVGKTYITCELIRRLRAEDCSVGAYKPVCSGSVLSITGQQTWSDLEELHSATGREFPSDRICPQRFHTAVAPPRAAALESRVVNESQLIDGLADWQSHVDYLLVEGAGGLLSPVSDQHTNASLAQEFGFPILIIARAGLGTINHTLLTIEAAQSRGLRIAGIILNETQPRSLVTGRDESLNHNLQDLRSWTNCPVLGYWSYQGHALVDEFGQSISLNWQERFDISASVG